MLLLSKYVFVSYKKMVYKNELFSSSKTSEYSGLPTKKMLVFLNKNVWKKVELAPSKGSEISALSFSN